MRADLFARRQTASSFELSASLCHDRAHIDSWLHVTQFVLALPASRDWASTSSMPDRPTIFALSSGRPPAAIAVIRISGPRAGEALKALAGKIPEPRKAAFARLRDPQTREPIDEALALWFPAPASETGEDVAELQLHGGRAVIAATLERTWQARGPAPGRGRRIHPPRLRERQARSDRGGRPRRPGDGRDRRPAPPGVAPDAGRAA